MGASAAGSRQGSQDGTLFRADNAWKTGRADRFGWLIDGENYFTALRECLERAEHEILIIGWDIDSTLELVRDPEHPHHPSPLAETLESLAERKPALRIHVLSWDFAAVYMLERELLPAYRFGWQDSERLHFHLDNRHATGASHHQKFVVVDGAIAFIGGFDLTKSRWDTRAHAPDDDRRVNSDGKAYRPFHDVQAIVAGEPARQLRELAAARWRRATGDALPDPDDDGPAGRNSRWPDSVPVRGEDVRYCLSRTGADPDGGDTVREVEQLFLDMIAAARRSIYIENQYFTAPTIADAIAARLEEDDGPEVVIVMPAETSGWLEQATMEMRRNRLVQRLLDEDRHQRLRVLAPVSQQLGDQSINVHGKVMIVDDRWLRIGSANLSCRSLGLDSECDLVIDDPNGDLAPALRADLVAEHLGADPDAIAAAIRDEGLAATVSAHAQGDRQLDRLQIAAGEYDAVLEPLAKIADMEEPLEGLWAKTGENDEPRSGDSADATGPAGPSSRFGWGFLAIVVIGALGWALWSAREAAQGFDPMALLDALRQSAAHPLAPVIAVPAMVAGSILVAPVTGMIALCALLFSPWVASLTAMVGTLAATAVNYAIGTRLGKVVEARAPPALASRMQSLGDSADALSLAGLRLIPIAPFTVVNLLAGALGVRLGRFLLGTLLGMGPGIVLICLSVDRARAALQGEPIFDPWIVGAIAAAGVAVVAFRAWQKRRGE